MQEDIKKALEVLRSGGIILYPTDTVWGLGCDATNAEAVMRIYEIKKQIDAKSMLVLVDSPARVQSYVEEVPEIAWELIDVSDKPLTIIYPDAKNLAPNLLADDKSIGIRVSTEAFSKTLCAQFRRPIVSTSANESGKTTPANFNAITLEIRNAVDYVVNFRQDDRSEAKSSSIIKLGKGNLFQIIRA
jgi:L-threonylcarbamoyladenylate synthase